MMETNTNWNGIPYDLHPRQTTKLWWECAQWSTMSNWHDSMQQEYQPRGVAILVTNKTAHRANQTRGRQNRIRTVVLGKVTKSVCRVPIRETYGQLTTYQQHQHYLAKINKTHKCLREVFWDDLADKVKEAQAMLLMDINEDVKDQTKKYIKAMGLSQSDHNTPHIKTTTNTPKRTRSHRWNLPVTVAT